MKNRTQKIIAAAVILLVAVAAPVFAGGDLPKYAPADTSLIISLNLRQITKTKVFEIYRKTISFEGLVKSSREDGIDIESALKDGEMCVFLDLNSMIARKGESDVAIYRGSQAKAIFQRQLKQAEAKVAEAVKKTAKPDPKNKAAVPELAKKEIDGKPAFVLGGVRNYTASILLDENTVQWSGAGDRAKLIAAPLKKNAATELTKAVDTSALLSIVWKANIPKELFKEGKDSGSSPEIYFLKNIATDLKLANLNVRESGEFLETRLTGTYGSEEAAKTARESLAALRDFCKSAISERDPEGAAALASIEISGEGKVVTATLKYRQDELAASIETWDKKARENLQKKNAPKKK